VKLIRVNPLGGPSASSFSPPKRQSAAPVIQRDSCRHQRQLSLRFLVFQVCAPARLLDKRFHLSSEQSQPRVPVHGSIAILQLSCPNRAEDLLWRQTVLLAGRLVAECRTFPLPLIFRIGHRFFQHRFERWCAEISRLVVESSYLHWLNEAKVVPLTAKTAPIDHDGWGDAMSIRGPQNMATRWCKPSSGPVRDVCSCRCFFFRLRRRWSLGLRGGGV
jgi:hypothetical protein